MEANAAIEDHAPDKAGDIEEDNNDDDVAAIPLTIAVPAAADVPAADVAAATDGDGDGTSYWEAPVIEASLRGKTLSTLDLSALESNHPEIQQKKKDDYWEAVPEKGLEGKTLSTPDMILLGKPSVQVEVLAASSPTATTNTTATTSTTTTITTKPGPVTAEEPETTPSYWEDAPIDKTLEGKKLSTLDITALETNHPDQQKEKTDDYWGVTPKEDNTLKGKTLSSLDLSTLESNHPDEQQKKKDDYWGGTFKEDTLKGKTLSTLDMTMLEANHPDEKKDKTDNYWEAPEEEKLKGKRLSVLDMKTLENNPGGIITEEEEEEQPTPSYWDDAPMEKSLQGKRLSAIDIAAMGKQHPDAKPKQGNTTPYWEWEGVKKLKKTLSKLSLSNLRRGSSRDVDLEDDDCVHGGTNGGPKSSSAASTEDTSGVDDTVKPITNRKHKLRDSWRMSFHKMSTNTLDQLDESSGSGPRLLGRRIFKSRNSLDISGGSQMSIGEDAIMF